MMSKLPNVLLGPELLWLLAYSLVVMIIRVSGSPVKSMDGFWDSMYYAVPLVLIPLTFMLYYVPGVIRPMLLLRLWIAGLIGGHFVLSRALQAYTDQGPGTGTAYFIGMILLFVLLIAGTIWALIKF